MTKGIRLNWIPFFVGKFLEVNMMNEWLELIERNEEQIINTGIEAYKEAIENTQLRYIVEINTNGEITTWYDVAGGNSFHMSTYNGKSLELIHFCMQNWIDDPIPDNDIEQKLQERGLYNRYLKERESQEVEDWETAEIVIINSIDTKLQNVLEECKQERKQFLIDEYARTEVENQLEEIKNVLDSFTCL
jgi:hypothetical protein